MKKRIRNRAELETYVQNFRILPDEFKKEILSWKEIAHSPYSHSFYSSKQKSWNFTPINCYRVSNHWNFRGKSRTGGMFIHSKTDKPVQNHTHWTLAVFDGRVWKVVKTLPMQKRR